MKEQKSLQTQWQRHLRVMARYMAMRERKERECRERFFRVYQLAFNRPRS